MNLFNNARRVSEYLLPHQLRAVESIFRLLGAVVVTAPATSSMKLKLGLWTCVGSVPIDADKERSVSEEIKGDSEWARNGPEMSMGMCSESCGDKRELEH
jgi:hypothetical protein